MIAGLAAEVEEHIAADDRAAAQPVIKVDASTGAVVGNVVLNQGLHRLGLEVEGVLLGPEADFVHQVESDGGSDGDVALGGIVPHARHGRPIGITPLADGSFADGEEFAASDGGVAGEA